MNIPESFYIALCMTVLLLGVVYWFWSQNQYIQRKINLLENIVYELKELCSNQTSFVGPPSEIKTTKYATPLSQVYYNPPESSVDHLTQNGGHGAQDLHETLLHEVNIEESEIPLHEFTEVEEHIPAEKPNMKIESPFFHTEETHDDLQPGGIGSGLKDTDVSDRSTALDSMTVKELRRLAEQRGIENALELRKKELIAKLRALAAPPTQSVLDAFNAHEEHESHELAVDELQTIELE
jgi:hypothetical protein